MIPINPVLRVIEDTNLPVFTTPSSVLTLKMKKKESTNKPYRKANNKVKGARTGRNKTVRIPPITATYVAPILLKSRDPNPSRSAWTTINILSTGDGTMVLVKNITTPRRVTTAILLADDFKCSPISYNNLRFI
jgi:hypothetical protein